MSQEEEEEEEAVDVEEAGNSTDSETDFEDDDVNGHVIQLLIGRFNCNFVIHLYIFNVLTIYCLF